MASNQLLLRELARLYGIQLNYFDVFSKLQYAKSESLFSVLYAMGAPVVAMRDVASAVRERKESLINRVLEPVYVAWDGNIVKLRLQNPLNEADERIKCKLDLEQGESLEWEWAPDNLTNTRIKVVEGKKYISRYGKIPWQIQAGYHTLNIEFSNNKNYQAMIISAPVKAYPVPDEEKSSWGVFLPLYALHSEHSWGSGDFGDLAQLTKWCGGIGGNIVGTLPLLSTSYEKKSNISPYTPWSRFFWNEIFLDINKIPELETSLLAKEILISEAFQDEIKYYRSQDKVDYQGISKLKHRILNELCREFYSRPSTRFDEYSRYIEDNPELERYAIFRATQEKLGDRWQSWPEAVRRVRIENSGYSESNKRYHQYVQWLATLQMRELLDDCKQSGVRLYLDLPAGVNQDGFDVWNNGSTFIKELSAGAPPDAVFQQGQYWNFPPFHPENLRNSHYYYIINSLRHILKNTGIIRIDHFMGVHRIFCIPKDTDASNGVYIHYKPDELYAILTLESIHSKTVVVGEDLGMVPDYVRTCMNRHGIYHTSVLHYELAMDPRNVLEKIPRKSIVSINTHDMASFAAFWKESDIEEKKKVGLIDEKSAIREHQLRKEAKQELINLLKEKGLLTEETKDDLQIALRAVIAMLSESKAEMFLLNLEDLWLETHFQNIPSSESYQNWRNKAQYSIEIFKEMPEVIELLNLLNAIRRKKSESVIISSEEPVTKPEVLYDYTLLTDDDLHFFNEGTHYRLYDKLGAHPGTYNGKNGTYFAVWAPNAQQVSVIGDFNDWDPEKHYLKSREQSGIWDGFLTGIGEGNLYKYHIESRHNNHIVDKADPFSSFNEVSPKTASVVKGINYEWSDQQWITERHKSNNLKGPMSIYEVHLGSWRRGPNNSFLSYREIAPQLAEYIKDMGFTHVEFLPIMEHPFYGSWGYQITGYFAPSSRYGTPQDFMYMIDHLHQNGIGVILDWVPSHFTTDEYGLGYFDGTHLYEHADSRKGIHPDWKSLIFNYGRKEVQCFLISSALFWLDRYHVDGLRIDAVASMLYLDYSRQNGDWVPNAYGGKENLEAIDLLRKLNIEIYQHFPDVQSIAEESTAWPMVSRPTHVGGLGFGMKWDMGWMHDILQYISTDPLFRKYHHNELTFRSIYALSENFILPLSHDEVVHGKGSLLGKMPGDDWQKRANLRLLLGYMYSQSGKKLLFMGNEFGQWREWNHDDSLDWHLLQYSNHSGLQTWVRDLNNLYRNEPALYELDYKRKGFEWVIFNDLDNSVISCLRKAVEKDDQVFIICNFTPVIYHNYHVGIPFDGNWVVLLNSDSQKYGGSGIGEFDNIKAFHHASHNQPFSLSLTLPPLSIIFLKRQK